MAIIGQKKQQMKTLEVENAEFADENDQLRVFRSDHARLMKNHKKLSQENQDIRDLIDNHEAQIEQLMLQNKQLKKLASVSDALLQNTPVSAVGQ